MYVAPLRVMVKGTKMLKENKVWSMITSPTEENAVEFKWVYKSCTNGYTKGRRTLTVQSNVTKLDFLWQEDMTYILVQIIIKFLPHQVNRNP